MAYTEKFEKAAKDVLRPGETVQAAVRGMSRGGTAAIAGGAAGGMVGSVGIAAGASYGQAATRTGDEQTEAAGFGALPAQLAFGLTDQRLLFFGRSSLTGAAKKLVAELPRDAIRAIIGEPSSNPMRPDQLTVHLDGDRTLEFEVVRNDGVATLIDAFDRTA